MRKIGGFRLKLPCIEIRIMIVSGVLKISERWLPHMGAISVTPEQLRASAKVYIHASQEITQQMQRVQNENNTMANEWRGQAFQAYLQQFEQLKGNVNQMTQLLEQIDQQLEKYANTVEQRDNEDRNAFGLH